MKRRWLLSLVCLGCALFYLSHVVAKSKGRLCVRYHSPSPTAVPGRVLYKIGRRTSMIAAGAFSASLGISSTMAAAVISRHPAGLYPAISQLSQPLSDGSGSLQGVIFDPNGAVIPGAVVTLTNSETKGTVIAVSDGSGCYRFAGIDAGTYHLKIEARGFATSDLPMLTTRSSDNNRIDQTLSIASINETVEIVAERFVVMGGGSMPSPKDPLVKAAQEDNLEALREALTTATANNRDKPTQATALEFAVQNGNREMIQLLLWAKADVNARNRAGQTVLMMLSDKVTSDVVWDLINAGAKINLRDNDGDTALSEIAFVNNTEVLKTLLEAGAKVNSTNNDGETALMNAVSERLVNNIRLLVNAGADINQRNKKGQSPLMFAKEGEHRAAVRLLISLGAIEFEEKEKKDEEP